MATAFNFDHIIKLSDDGDDDAASDDDGGDDGLQLVMSGPSGQQQP